MSELEIISKSNGAYRLNIEDNTSVDDDENDEVPF